MITTQAELSRQLNIHPSTASRYLTRHDFPVSRTPPWTPEQVGEIRRWQAEWLQPDRSGKGRTPGADGFYAIHAPQHTPIAVVLTDGIVDAVARDPLLQPAEICSQAERDILTGTRKPTRAEVAQLVTLAVRLKAMLACACEWLPAYLGEVGATEAQRRMRAAVYPRLGWHAEAVARALGQTPAGGKGEGE